MLKRIQMIKGLGVYNDYTSPAGTEDFSVKNLIYGWNYSGKTTLSRLFTLLETKKSNPDLPPFTFSIDTDQGVVSEKNYQSSMQVVRVFNSDFVADNLNFTGSPFNPIFLLGTDSDATEKEIERCDNMLKRSKRGSDKSESDATAAKKAMSDAKTEAAQHVKATMSLVTFFGAVQLDKELQTVGLGLEDYRLSDEAYEADIKLARTSDQEQLPPVSNVLLTLNLHDLYKSATTLLAKTPDLTSTIEHLVDNPLIEKWVEDGLSLHDEKETCEFCGGSLDEHHTSALRAHFSKDLANHKQEVQGLLIRAEAASLAVPEIKDVEFNAQFRKRVNEAQASIQDSIEAHNDAISRFAKDIKGKIEVPFKAIELKTVDVNLMSDVENALAELNSVIDDNNKVASNFITEKAAAIRRLKLHFAQKFAEKVDIDRHAAKMKRLARYQKKFERCSERLEVEIRRLNAIISQAQRGREEINKRIENLLGSESVQITVVKFEEKERFQLVRRDGKVAKHLSEGEKTAIAFAFFLTKLSGLKELSEAIIYIDDPISSLDSNHIFQVTAMIKEYFFYQDGDTGPWGTRCKQAFFFNS